MGYFPSFLFGFIVLQSLLSYLHMSAAFESDKSTQSGNHFHIVEVSSLLPASTCNPSARVLWSKEESLKLVHNYGPCSPRKKHGKANDAPSMLEILERDQKRVSMMIAKRHVSKINNTVQVKWDGILNSGEYVVNVGLGTPRRDLTLVMDTGSSLLWTQCPPCKVGTLKGCYKQKHPLFDPSKSSTYSNISCPSRTCTLTKTALGNSACISKTCAYRSGYVDGSGIAGYLAKERLRVGSKTFNEFIFGCNEANIDNSLPNIDGIIGLGQDFLSFVEQTAKTYNRVFSYCLPSKTSEIGFLKFGKTKRQVSSKSLIFTKLGADQAIDLVGIKIGNTSIPINVKKGAATIDSGTVVSRIPSKSYVTLKKAYRKAMSRYKLAEPLGAFDTCHHIGGHQKLIVPKVRFLFGDGVVLDIPQSGVALHVVSDVVCLAFAAPPGGGTGGGDDDETVLFGSSQQQTLEIVYDVSGGKLGFGYGACN